MFQKTRGWVSSLVHKPHFLKLTTLLVIFLISVCVMTAFNVKTINAQVDGKDVKITTVYGTVGQALAHSSDDFYPEDIVTPDRDTKVTQGMTVEVTRSVPVRLTVDQQTFATRTTAKTVGEAIQDLSGRYGLQIKDFDEVNALRSDPLKSQMDIEVRRAVPVVVKADGKTLDTYLAPRTVAEALKKLNIVLGAKDKVSLALDHILAPDDQLKVTRVAEVVETVHDAIPFQTVTQPGDYPVGLPDQIVSRGSNGLQEQTVRVTLEDGKEVDRQVLSQKILSPPKNQLVSRGSQTTVSRGGQTISFKRAYVMRATAYCIPGGTTRSGTPVHWGVAAVDPGVISLGSKVYVEGYGSASALDTGGMIRGNRIDLYMNSEAAADAWGVRNVLVYVQ